MHLPADVVRLRSPARTIVALLAALCALGLPRLHGQAAGGELTPADRLTGLAVLWSEAAANFAFFDRVPALDWTATFREFAPQAAAAATTLDYYRVLQRFVARLQDGHTRVYLPDSVVQRGPYDTPWVRLQAVERRAIVYDVGRSLAPALPIGSEILSVDGVATAEHLRREVFPYMAVSGDHVRWRDGVAGNVAQGWGLLVGPTGTAVTITARTPGGELVSLELARVRRAGGDAWSRPPVRREPLELGWDTAGGEPRQLTFGERGESAPAWSPDGATIAFRAARGTGSAATPQIWILPRWSPGWTVSCRRSGRRGASCSTSEPTAAAGTRWCTASSTGSSPTRSRDRRGEPA